MDTDNKYEPKEIKPVAIMIPVSSIIRWFKKKFKKEKKR